MTCNLCLCNLCLCVDGVHPLDAPAVTPAPLSTEGFDPACFLARQASWPRAVGGYYFIGGCPRCLDPNCEPDADGWLSCEGGAR